MASRSTVEKHAKQAKMLLESDTFGAAMQWCNGLAMAEAASAKTPDDAFRASMMLQAIQSFQSRIVAFVKHGESAAAKLAAEQEQQRDALEKGTLVRDYQVAAKEAREVWDRSKDWEQEQ